MRLYWWFYHIGYYFHMGCYSSASLYMGFVNDFTYYSPMELADLGLLLGSRKGESRNVMTLR